LGAIDLRRWRGGAVQRCWRGLEIGAVAQFRQTGTSVASLIHGLNAARADAGRTLAQAT
jgi:hypothetical protein